MLPVDKTKSFIVSFKNSTLNSHKNFFSPVKNLNHTQGILVQNDLIKLRIQEGGGREVYLFKLCKMNYLITFTSVGTLVVGLGLYIVIVMGSSDRVQGGLRLKEKVF